MILSKDNILQRLPRYFSSMNLTCQYYEPTEGCNKLYVLKRCRGLFKRGRKRLNRMQLTSFPGGYHDSFQFKHLSIKRWY